LAKPWSSSGISRDADSEASLDEREAYVTHTPLPPPTGLRATILKIALVMVAAEVFIMLCFDLFGIELSGWNLALVDAALLTLIVAPIAYFAFVRPKDRQIRKVIMALEEAKLDAEDLARLPSAMAAPSHASCSTSTTSRNSMIPTGINSETGFFTWLRE
jgi:hypothetical protein